MDVLYGRAPSPLRREWQSNYRKTGNGGEFSFAAMAKRDRERRPLREGRAFIRPRPGCCFGPNINSNKGSSECRFTGLTFARDDFVGALVVMHSISTQSSLFRWYSLLPYAFGFVLVETEI